MPTTSPSCRLPLSAPRPSETHGGASGLRGLWRLRQPLPSGPRHVHLRADPWPPPPLQVTWQPQPMSHRASLPPSWLSLAVTACKVGDRAPASLLEGTAGPQAFTASAAGSGAQGRAGPGVGCEGRDTAWEARQHADPTGATRKAGSHGTGFCTYTDVRAVALGAAGGLAAPLAGTGALATFHPPRVCIPAGRLSPPAHQQRDGNGAVLGAQPEREVLLPGSQGVGEISQPVVSSEPHLTTSLAACFWEGGCSLGTG